MSVNDAIKTLKNEGHKMTHRRKTILNYFYQTNGYRTARNLYEHMEAEFPGISYDTVYRNLHLFHDLNILESTSLNAEKHFRLNCSGQHHHHFICNTCGKTKRLNICPMDDIGNMLENYLIDGHKFEVYGLCPACQEAS